MALFQLTHGLNRAGQERVVAQARQTHVGQAHFGGSGPAGKTCRECISWQKTGSWHAMSGKHGGTPLPARCGKYRDLMRETGRAVPHSAYACRYFVASDSPQPLHRPQKRFE